MGICKELNLHNLGLVEVHAFLTFSINSIFPIYYLLSLSKKCRIMQRTRLHNLGKGKVACNL